MKKVSIPMEELMPLLQLQMDTAGCACLTVTGWSMLPMLHNRKDRVTIVPATGQEKKGDVILYLRDNGKYVLHRILQVKKDGYVLCGDNQFFTERVRKDQVLAVVSGFTRNEKNYQVDHKGYRAYTFWWVALHPVRWAYLGPRRVVGWLKTKLRKRRG